MSQADPQPDIAAFIQRWRPSGGAERANYQLFLSDLAERRDAHRKRQQDLHPKLTLTNIYNVLEKLRAGEPLTDKDRKIHEQCLVTTLKQLHDDLDIAVAQAHGWEDLVENGPQLSNFEPQVSEQQVLTRLVELNHQRAAEEAQGQVRWLRPDYQAPESLETGKLEAGDLGLDIEDAAKITSPATRQKLEKRQWPEALPDQMIAVRAQLLASGEPLTSEELAKTFQRMTKNRKARLQEILQTLAGLGQTKQTPDQRYASG